MIELTKYTQRELLNLPVRKWNEVKRYNSLIIVPTGKKHDSGYHIMAIVGTNRRYEPIEIAAFCDDICWFLPTVENYQFRNDMLMKSRCIHFHTMSLYEYEVGISLSTTDVTLVKR